MKIIMIVSTMDINTNCILITYLYIIPKNKKFGCVGRGDLTFLFKSCEIDKSLFHKRGDLSSSVEDNKSFTNRPSGLQK